MLAIVLRFLATVIALPICARYMEGVHAGTDQDALVVGLVLAVIYLALRPILRLILSVFNFCTLGLLNVALDTFFIWTAADVGGGVSFDSVWWAVAVAFAVTALRLCIDVLTGSLKK